MKNYSLGSRLLKPVLLVGFILFTLNSAFCQWQATMINGINDPGIEYLVFSDMNQYRYDVEMDANSGSVIVKPQQNKTAILIHNDKYVHFSDNDGSLSIENDPFQAYNALLKTGTEKIEGTEEIEGYNCVIKTLSDQQGDAIFTMWYSEELHFPIKLICYKSEGTGIMILKEITDWETDPQIFQVPNDYVEVDRDLHVIEK